MAIPTERSATLDSLSRIFLAEFRANFPHVGANEDFTDRVVVSLPSKAAIVGPLEVMMDGDEITVYLGRHHHVHFSTYMHQDLAGEAAERAITLDALTYIRDILEDRIVIWSREEGGRYVAGGAFYRDGASNLVDPNGQGFLWSGKRVDISARRGA